MRVIEGDGGVLYWNRKGSSSTIWGWRKETLHRKLAKRDGSGLGDVSLSESGGPLLGASIKGSPTGLAWVISIPHTKNLHGPPRRGLGCLTRSQCLTDLRTGMVSHSAYLLVPLSGSIVKKVVILLVVSCQGRGTENVSFNFEGLSKLIRTLKIWPKNQNSRNGMELDPTAIPNTRSPKIVLNLENLTTKEILKNQQSLIATKFHSHVVLKVGSLEM